MNLKNRLRLSYYKEIADIDTSHDVRLVQHTVSGKIFVKKTLSIYDLQVFLYLGTHPIEGTPYIEELIEDGQTLYVIEEYISGSSLQEILDKKGALTEEKAVAYLLRICQILQPLHQQNPSIVHRDIKPSNLIITAHDTVVLVDFNSAKEYHKERPQDTVLFGTAGYAAPEQYGFSPSAPSTDVYALGVLLHQMLTGGLPNEVTYSGKLSHIIAKCTAMDPQKRYTSADDLIHALQKIQHKKSDAISMPTHTSYALPGFRSKKKRFMIPAAFWYLIVVTSPFLVESEGMTGITLIAYQITCFAILFGATLWFGNYRNIWRYFPLCCHNKLIVRILGILFFAYVWLFLIFCGLAVVLELIP